MVHLTKEGAEGVAKDGRFGGEGRSPRRRLHGLKNGRAGNSGGRGGQGRVNLDSGASSKLPRYPWRPASHWSLWQQGSDPDPQTSDNALKSCFLTHRSKYRPCRFPCSPCNQAFTTFRLPFLFHLRIVAGCTCDICRYRIVGRSRCYPFILHHFVARRQANRSWATRQPERSNFGDL